MSTAAVDASVFRCGYLERIPLGTSYVGIVQHVARLLARLPAGAELAIDFTGVGRPVADMFFAAGLSPTLVLITGGATETFDGGVIGVPKLVLISRLQALLHQQRLKIHRDLAEAAELVRELQDFRVEFTAAGSITFGARVGRHDDLVLALAIAAWRAHGSGPSDGFYQLVRAQAAALTGVAATLAQAGIDKNLAHKARTAAAIPAPEFEAVIADGV